MAELIGFDTHLGNCVSNIQMSPQVTKIQPVHYTLYILGCCFNQIF